MSKDLTWLDAIKQVLRDESGALHYAEIASIISEKGYRKSMGATPASTVSATLSSNTSVFAKVSSGVYILKDLADATPVPPKNESSKTEDSEVKLIKSMGIYWDRDLIHWTTAPNMFGKQLKGSSEVNFATQVGIYLLYDHREIIYVGQAVGQSIVKRLKQHTEDRHQGRWNRFSWFGFHEITEDGKLIINTKDKLVAITLDVLANAMEAVLIESIEPRQNRKQGNKFEGIEYIQVEDPEIEKKKEQKILQNLISKAGLSK
jgi:HB1, ASXL, restriction endonuclease HTH domain